MPHVRDKGLGLMGKKPGVLIYFKDKAPWQDSPCLCAEQCFLPRIYFRRLFMGHQSVKPDCRRFSPAKAVKISQYSE